MVVILLRLGADTEFLRDLLPKRKGEREGGGEGGGEGGSPGASRASKRNPPVLLTYFSRRPEEGGEPHAALESVWT